MERMNGLTSFQSRKCITLLTAVMSNPLKTFSGSLPASISVGGDTKHDALPEGMLSSTSHTHLQREGQTMVQGSI